MLAGKGGWEGVRGEEQCLGAKSRTILPWIHENLLRGSSILVQKSTLHYSEQRADSGGMHAPTILFVCHHPPALQDRAGACFASGHCPVSSFQAPVQDPISYKQIVNQV